MTSVTETAAIKAAKGSNGTSTEPGTSYPLQNDSGSESSSRQGIFLYCPYMVLTTFLLAFT